MRVERLVDTERGTVRISFELPLGMDPERGVDLVWPLIDELLTSLLPQAPELPAGWST